MCQGNAWGLTWCRRMKKRNESGEENINLDKLVGKSNTEDSGGKLRAGEVPCEREEGKVSEPTNGRMEWKRCKVRRVTAEPSCCVNVAGITPKPDVVFLTCYEVLQAESQCCTR